MINKYLPAYIPPLHFSLFYSISQSPRLLYPYSMVWSVSPSLPLESIRSSPLELFASLLYLIEFWSLDQCMMIWAKGTILLEGMTSPFCFISSIAANDQNVSSLLSTKLKWGLHFRPEPLHPWCLTCFEPSQRGKLSMTSLSSWVFCSAPTHWHISLPA